MKTNGDSSKMWLFFLGGGCCSRAQVSYGMSTKNYNSFPEAPELMLDEAGVAHVIRNRQPVEEIWKHEVAYK